MTTLSNSLLVDTLLALTILLGLLYYYLTVTFDYWKKRRVPYLEPTVLFGNIKDQFLLKKPNAFILQDIYNGLAGEKFGGYFESRTPVLMIRDPVMIERVLIKDFSYFSDRDLEINAKLEPLTASLFSLKGHMWKNLRNKLTPTFTTGKLKGMFDQICNCADELINEIEKNSLSNKTMDSKKMGFSFSIDVIASCSFGLQFNPNSPEGIKFRQMVDGIFSPSPFRLLQMSFVMYLRTITKFFQIRQIPKKLNDYIIDLVKTTMKFREKNNIQRNDFLQLMMSLKAQETSGKKMNWKTELNEEDAYLNQLDYMKDGPEENEVTVITDECIAAQAFVFLTAGSESVANSVMFSLYELACNTDVQKRLQQEIDTVLNKYEGKLTYEGLKEMTYLDMIIQERNRKYSDGGFLLRVCVSPYTIPGTNVIIEKGTRIVVPLYAIHNDPDHYPDPEKFIPERFEANNHRSSGMYLPFGDGPRVCIAMRFVILELKVCIAKVMAQYSVSLDSTTKVPLQWEPKAFTLRPLGGIQVKFHRRTRNSS